LRVDALSSEADTGKPGLRQDAVSRQRPRWAKPLRVHLSVIIVLLLVAISVPLMWLTFQEGQQSAIASAHQQMRLLSRNTIDLYASVFHDGNSVVTMGSVLPSLTAEPPAYLDAKREYLVRALKSTPHIDAVYIGYPGGAFFQIMRATTSPRWHAAASAPDDAILAMRVVTRAPDGPALATWHFLDGDGRPIGAGPQREVEFDPRRRPWYRDAIGAAGTVTTGPYISASTEALTLTLAATMAAEKGAVIGVDVMLETIGQMLMAGRVGALGRLRVRRRRQADRSFGPGRHGRHRRQSVDPRGEQQDVGGE
jgi:adenylate cyclase